ncbi:ABC transporter substrate-binding protein [Faecalicatena sp. AGMB00832]|uniref:ABC transporter substrate-binding protein n=1 Tax=Faecalicatena faecalis TaxID=2726362 RepID=A0ABS6D8U4_9FIRM|nr:ABC transporter substrate-binding protein [Faecalicatena faecalis]MBU3878032.1 ABC transporter substrate-binding protein [Faecalicatena faecalis]
MMKLKKIAALGLALVMAATSLTACGGKKGETNENGEEIVELTWYQVGDTQKDAQKVIEKVNEYTTEKIGVKLNIINVGWGDYNQKMQVVINTGDKWDMCFTCSWANDYLQNANKGAFLELDEYLEKEGKEMHDLVDPRFWEAAKIGGVTYGVPHEKEIGSCPMWVFTKEYVDKYNIPYQDIHTLEDLEPWLKLIHEKEPDVVPLYLTKDYTAPTYMDKIQDPVGIEYGDDTLTVKNVFETERMKSTLKTMRKYYTEGYVNKDAATASDDKSIKRFVTKGDGQPYAELIWGKDLGYEVVATEIMDTQITNASARGALTAINKNCEHPEKAVEFLNLMYTDEYLRNLLNYGIEGEHYEFVEPAKEEIQAAEGKEYVYDKKVRLNEETKKDYSVPYWVQGGMFNTYVLENEPLDKWAAFKEFNDASKEAPSFGFDFDLEPVSTQVAGFRNILDEFGKSLYTGSVDPDEYLPQLQKKLEATGIQDVIDEMQSQIDEWKAQK